MEPDLKKLSTLFHKHNLYLVDKNLILRIIYILKKSNFKDFYIFLDIEKVF